MQAVAQEATTNADVDQFFYLIKGQTKKGGKFRPSDWADRLIGAVAFYAREHHGNPREISGRVCIIDRAGVKSIIFDPLLREIASGLYDFLQSFARDNNLEVELLDQSEWNQSRRRIITKPKRQFV